ncbi:CPBP family intramembrane glutamic endopeptidase [Plantactinospora sp. KLBMP9567]|uniref:CPBP family intramembrane glutamic endopeptidase n=1 Tax=Plantactinospora sp. KLBMP9567 TaxID=3085900 RepID=UPI002981923D|nr:CPBP family intramembrane glutamic endopeptidase [Plantactinospora sp. KLBMP9567]MDW5322502.1 CPBP family intramembrane glutamic endopeptidase [Plantactinospora sp. KLBMP9567]
MTADLIPAAGPPAVPPTAARRGYLAVEYTLLFFGAVLGYVLAGSPGSPIPPLLLLAGLAAGYLWRRPDFDRRSWWGRAALRAEWLPMLRLWTVAAVLAVAALAVLAPDRLFALPRQSPLLWAAIMVFYPLFSVYPQELIFRGFLMHRYAPVFGSGRWLVAASAVAFGFVHLIFGNALSVLATLAGGWLFARRYQRTGSLLVASVEHALYGLLVFTVGLGDFFYHGAA